LLRLSEVQVVNDVADQAFRRHYAQIYRYVRRRTRNHHSAEELTQQVFADAAASLRADGPPVLAWLYTVARRRLIDLARRRSREPLALTTCAEPVQPEPAYEPAIVEVLVEALRLLPHPQRRVVVEKVFEGRTFAEIAARLGINEDAARMRFSRGLARLRTELERKGVAP
jgi:RNA polymerase sigma-70 factor (ECF subfamily)